MKALCWLVQELLANKKLKVVRSSCGSFLRAPSKIAEPHSAN